MHSISAPECRKWHNGTPWPHRRLPQESQSWSSIDTFRALIEVSGAKPLRGLFEDGDGAEVWCIWREAGAFLRLPRPDGTGGRHGLVGHGWPLRRVQSRHAAPVAWIQYKHCERNKSGMSSKFLWGTFRLALFGIALGTAPQLPSMAALSGHFPARKASKIDPLASIRSKSIDLDGTSAAGRSSHFLPIDLKAIRSPPTRIGRVPCRNHKNWHTYVVSTIGVIWSETPSCASARRFSG